MKRSRRTPRRGRAASSKEAPRSSVAPKSEERPLSLDEALAGQDDLSERVRLRLAIDVVMDLAAGKGHAIAVQPDAPRMQLRDVSVDRDGSAHVRGVEKGSGVGLLVWEIIAGHPAPEGEVPRLRDSVDEVATDVDELMARVLAGEASFEHLEAFAEALEGASEGHAGSRLDVARAFGFAPPDPDPEPAASRPVPDPEPTVPRRVSTKAPAAAEATAAPPDSSAFVELPPVHIDAFLEAFGPSSEEAPTETVAPPGVIRARRAAPAAEPPPEAADAPPLWVVYEGHRYRIGTKPFVIGRSKGTTDLRIVDTTITRHHARVEFVEGSYYIVDLGSLNGIEYQGELVSRHAIADGDVYALCGHELRFSFRDEDAS